MAATYEITDTDLRINHDFVAEFEWLRRAHDFHQLSDAALQVIANHVNPNFEDLRIARHLRNAIAHGNEVNRSAVAKYLALLRGTQGGGTDVQRVRRPSESADRSAFRIHAWRDPRLEQEMIANGFVSLGGDEIGDLSDVSDAEVIRASLRSSMPDREERAISIFVGYWRRFLWEASIGDLIVLPTQTLGVAIGEFAGPYFYTTSVGEKVRHRRAVAWLRHGIERDEFPAGLTKVISGRHSIQDFNSPNAVGQLEALVGRNP